MKKVIISTLFINFLLFHLQIFMIGELIASTDMNKASINSNYKKAYFAGGCFWCMEESFDKIDGVIQSVSGYSGGHLKNPTYEDVIYKDTGHVETIEIMYDPSKISYNNLLNVFWKNIDPFDAEGQFCDKGKSYRSVIFFQNQLEKEFINESFKDLENKFSNKIVTLVWKFDKFYPAEDYHQDYYEKNFIRYLMYKKGCKREETLKRIWN